MDYIDLQFNIKITALSSDFFSSCPTSLVDSGRLQKAALHSPPGSPTPQPSHNSDNSVLILPVRQFGFPIKNASPTSIYTLVLYNFNI